jgi:hypothetical protein
MKNNILLAVLILVLQSCGIQEYPLKNKYDPKPYVIESPRSFEEVWGSLVDMAALQGLSIKFLDKLSGLMVSERNDFLNNYTFERPDGKLQKQDAFLVVKRYSSRSQSSVTPLTLTAEWNVRVKATQNGKTLINVNLVRPMAESPSLLKYGIFMEVYSTGQFERYMAESIK